MRTVVAAGAAIFGETGGVRVARENGREPDLGRPIRAWVRKVSSRAKSTVGAMLNLPPRKPAVKNGLAPFRGTCFS